MGDADPGRNDVEVLPSAALEAADTQRAALLQTFEDKRAARQIAVPTSEEGICVALRRLSQPICFFGEDLHDRRERLRAALATEARSAESGAAHLPPAGRITAPAGGASSEDVAAGGSDEGGAAGGAFGRADRSGEDKLVEEEYYVEGTAQVRALRYALALPTLERARRRLQQERELRSADGGRDEAKSAFQAAEAKAVECVRGGGIMASQVGDTRPLSAVSFGLHPGRISSSTNDRSGAGVWSNVGDWIVVTGSWSGNVKIWGGGAEAKLLQTISMHTGRVSSVYMNAEHPRVLLTAAADLQANMFLAKDIGSSEDPVLFEHATKFGGHTQRVSDCRMHPGREALVVTCSYDGTFILHDSGKSLLTQTTGHENVCTSAFHPDGSLLATCGTEGGVRLWDMRSGRAVMTMAKAHVGTVACLDFSGDGRVLASGGGDNTVKIWDLRGKRCGYTIPAHVGLVSAVRFAGGGGDVLVSSSFDKSVKIWSSRRGWALLKDHPGHEDKVTALDVTPDAQWIVSATYDKTFKLWGVD